MSRDPSAPDVLAVSLGQASLRGRKAENQDFHGAHLPRWPALATKGIVVALADGISTSARGREAAEMAVQAMTSDYYDTPESWTVRTSAGRVIDAVNAWLHAQGRRAHVASADEGWVTTLAALVLKGRRAHVLHVGDSRVWRLAGRSLQPLTEDHLQRLDADRPMLSRALGAAARVEVDHRTEEIAPGDVFLLTTDGVHDALDMRGVAALVAAAPTPQAAAEAIARAAQAAGGADDITVQVVRVDTVPPAAGADLAREAGTLPVPAPPRPGDVIDGLRVIRPLHVNHRSHIHLVEGPDGARAAMKIPATDLRDDPGALRHFAMEDWIARRIDSPHVLRAAAGAPRRTKLYTLTEYVEGRTLRQWMHDTPAPSLEAVRGIVEQIVAGLRAFHRREMLHRDLRPENVMLDADGSVRIIDFGAVHVAGVAEAARTPRDDDIPGTMQYAAPEHFAGEAAGPASDLYSLGVIAYELLTGHLPYGAQVARVRSRRDRLRLRYRPARDAGGAVPDWVDHALRRAVHPDPGRRHPALSEFAADLRRPAPDWTPARHVPLIERDPVRVWQAVSLALAIAVAVLLARLP